MKEKDVVRTSAVVLRSLRCCRRCSQEGFNPAHLSRMQMGDIDPRLTTLLKYAKSLHVQLSVLIGELERELAPPAARAQVALLPKGETTT